MVWLHAPERSRVLALTRSGKAVRFYDMDARSGLAWKPVRTFDAKPAPSSPGQGAHPVLRDRTLVLQIEKHAHVYDLESRVWRDEKQPALYAHAIQPDGREVAVLASIWGTGSKAAWRSPAGKWIPIERPVQQYSVAGHSLPFMGASGTYYAPGAPVEQRSDGTLREVPVVHLLWSKTHNRRYAWRHASEMPATCHQLAPQVSTEQHIFVRCLDGRVLRTDDQGQTWIVDRDLPGEQSPRRRTASLAPGGHAPG